MQLNYRGMSQDDVYPAIQKWQDHFDSRLADWESIQNTQELQRVQANLQEEVVTSWWKLADFIVMKYNDGKVNWPKAGVAIGYPEEYAKMIGFSNDVHPVWVQAAEVPPVAIDGYVPSSARMPAVWHSDTATWTYPGDASLQAATTASRQSPIILQFLVTSLAVGFGIVLGRVYERRKVSAADAYRPFL